MTNDSNMKGSAHVSFPLLYNRFASELFTKNDDLESTRMYTRSAIPELSSKVIITSQKQYQYLVHTSKNYHKLVKKGIECS